MPLTSLKEQKALSQLAWSKAKRLVESTKQRIIYTPSLQDDISSIKMKVIFTLLWAEQGDQLSLPDQDYGRSGKDYWSPCI